MGLGFIGVIDQESHQYPMTHLQRKQFTCRGDFYGLVYELLDEGVTVIMAFERFDRYR